MRCDEHGNEHRNVVLRFSIFDNESCLKQYECDCLLNPPINREERLLCSDGQKSSLKVTIPLAFSNDCVLCIRCFALWLSNPINMVSQSTTLITYSDKMTPGCVRNEPNDISFIIPYP